MSLKEPRKGSSRLGPAHWDLQKEYGPPDVLELGKKLIRDQDCDDKHRNLFKLKQGRLAAWIYCGSAKIYIFNQRSDHFSF